MQCLVVHAHPNPESFNTALADQAVAALSGAGHNVETINLYKIGFDPCMSEAEHLDYDSIALDHPDPIIRQHIEMLNRAEMLVFVYPTWWSGTPAMLKGWLERVFLPEVAFTLTADCGASEAAANGSQKTDKASVRPLLTNVRRVVGITTYGSKRTDVLLLGDAGRRTITRTVRLVCAKRCRTTWLGLHQLDTSSRQTREAFLEQVATKLAAIKS